MGFPYLEMTLYVQTRAKKDMFPLSKLMISASWCKKHGDDDDDGDDGYDYALAACMEGVRNDNDLGYGYATTSMEGDDDDDDDDDGGYDYALAA
ncbi:hypothetical protein ACFX2B_025985 [Malus domestica]